MTYRLPPINQVPSATADELEAERLSLYKRARKLPKNSPRRAALTDRLLIVTTQLLRAEIDTQPRAKQ